MTKPASIELREDLLKRYDKGQSKTQLSLVVLAAQLAEAIENGDALLPANDLLLVAERLAQQDVDRSLPAAAAREAMLDFLDLSQTFIVLALQRAYIQYAS